MVITGLSFVSGSGATIFHAAVWLERELNQQVSTCSSMIHSPGESSASVSANQEA